MPNCKNGKVILLRFTTQGLIKSDFHKKKFFTREYLDELITL